MFRLSRDSQLSYSQCGEDLIIDFLLRAMGIAKPYYLDLGANHPRKLSNTYSFYRRGARGVLVEPNPHLARKLRRVRPGDKVVECAVSSGGEDHIDLHVMNSHELSTTDATHAQKVSSHQYYEVSKTVSVPALSLNQIFERNIDREVDLCSFDIEANMADIAAQLDFDRFRPRIWCVETIIYDPYGSSQRDWGLIDLFLRQGYWIYADTMINTIFVRGDWDRLAQASILAGGLKPHINAG